MTKLKLCRYPNNGFGEQNNQWYFLDQFGRKFETYYEYDRVGCRMDIWVEIFGKEYYASNIEELVEDVRGNYKVSKF